MKHLALALTLTMLAGCAPSVTVTPYTNGNTVKAEAYHETEAQEKANRAAAEFCGDKKPIFITPTVTESRYLSMWDMIDKMHLMLYTTTGTFKCE